MSIEKIYNMSNGGGKIPDMKIKNYPEDDIRNADPKLFYRGKDGRECYATDALEAANKRHFGEYFPIIEEKPTRGRR